MTIRKWLDDHSGVAIVVLVVILVSSLSFTLFWTRRSSEHGGVPKPQQVFYYDLNSQNLFAASSAQVSPIMAPSGAGPKGEMAGVRAHVFSCGSCNENDRHVGWLDMYSAEGHRKLDSHFGPDWSPKGPTSPDELESMLTPGDHLIASSDGTTWAAMHTPEANRIMEEALKPCPSGERPHECNP